jgi:putative ABC transport system permease protein
MKSRCILLIFALSTLALIGLSQLREISDDIKFPAKYLLHLSSDNAQVNTQSVYQLLLNNSNKNKQNLFRTYLDDQGNESNFSFLNTKKNKQNFETDINNLANVSFEGSYYSDQRFTEDTLQKLTNHGVHVETTELQWHLAGVTLWTEGIRAVGLWCLVLSIFFAYFSLLYLYRKNNYVARFMGVSPKFTFHNWLIDSFVIMSTSVIIFVLFSFVSKNSLDSMGSLAFISILVVNALLLLFLILLGNLLFYQITKYGNILSILKGVNAPISINVIWFTGIVVTLLVIPLILNKITRENEILTQQLQSLEPWQRLDTYRTITVSFPNDDVHQSENELIDVNEVLDYGKSFMAYFSDEDYIFAQKSTVTIPEQLSTDQKKELLKDYSKDNINPEIMEHVIYMNEHAYQLNAQLQNRNTNNQAHQAPATIYIPVKYEADSDSVINATYMEFFQHSEITRTDFAVVVIPNGLETFLFDYNGADLIQFDKSRTQFNLDEIIVVLNMNEVFHTPSAIMMYSNITNGLFSADALARLASDPVLTKNLSNVISPYKSIKLKINRLKDRINSAKLAVFVLVLIQFIIVLQFFTGMLRQHLKAISVQRLLGININKVLFTTLKYYLIFLFIAFLAALFITKDVLTKYFIFGGSIIEISVTFFILKGVISKKTGDFLKGDFEI